jgi:GntR family transcriptional regulator / MocR family aminotransferase
VNKRRHSNGYLDIYERYRTNILSGAIAPGGRVPSIRVLANELGVAKKTVESAYNILIGEGYLLSRGAKGTIVNPELNVRIDSRIPKTAPSPVFAKEDASLRQGDFRLGVPAFDAFPIKAWRRIATHAVNYSTVADLDYPSPTGYLPLKNALASYLGVSRGISCFADQIFITNGYNDSMELILKALYQRNEKFVLEDPGYFMTSRILASRKIGFRLSAAGASGLDVPAFLAKHQDARFVSLTPTHHNPLVGSMPLAARRRLLAWAARKKSWILEDDYDGEFHYEKRLIPSLKSLDEKDRVIYIGTFGKSIMPGVRVGYIVVPASLQPRFLASAVVSHAGQSVLIQKILARFVSEGHFFKHLKKMRPLYRERRRMVIAAVEKVFPGRFRIEANDGGLHLVAHLDQARSDVQLAASWRERGIAVKALSDWYRGAQKKFGLVIGFTNIRSEEEAVNLLAKVKDIGGAPGKRPRVVSPRRLERRSTV